MNLWQKLLAPFNKASRTPVDANEGGRFASLPNSVDLPDYMRRGLSPSEFRELQIRNVNWVFVCASKNAKAIAESTPRLYRKRKSRNEEQQEVLSHPVIDLISRPNDDQSCDIFWEHHALQYELTGNAYLFSDIVDTKPQSLWSLDPSRVDFVRDQSGQSLMSGWKYYLGNQWVTLERDEIGHWKMPSPLHPIYGAGWVASVLGAIDIDLLTDSLQESLMRNRAVPSMWLNFSKMPTAPEAKRIRKMWDRVYGNLKRPAKLGISGGDMEVTRVGMTNEEAGVEWISNWDRQRICAAAGVPLSMVTTEDVNRANAETGEYVYAKYTLKPRLCSRDAMLNHFLLRRFGDDGKYEFISDDPVPDNEDFELRENEVIAKLGIITINEAREMFDMPPIKGGDVLLQAAQNVPVSAPIRMAVPIKAKQLEPGDEHENKTLTDAVRRVFHSQRIHVLSALGKAYTKGAEGAMIDVEYWNKVLAEATKPHLLAPFMDAAYAGAQQAGASIAFDLTNEAAVSAVDRTVNLMANRVNATTLAELKEIISRGLESGLSIEDMKREISQTFDVWENGDSTIEGETQSRAETVARSEEARAVTAGTEEGYMQAGVEVKEWNAAGDSCPFCLAMHGRRIAVGVPFFKQGDTMRAGGQDLALDYADTDGPPLHPNCRCALLPVVNP